MRRIKDIIFTKFKNIETPDSIIVEESKKAINETLNMDIPDHYYKIIFNKPYLIIKSPVSALKNEIFIKKEEIIERIKKKTNKNEFIKILFR
ncbi:hypothetical protein KKA27_03510 [Patescibacteria group bacterium]|nr:hypothetical protein [Patescibacteria group bacterium]MBU2633333.1 hypothetical protein [Patescibacteria group bacterium]